jgi:uncharacterized protein (UPF0147 family)
MIIYNAFSAKGAIDTAIDEIRWTLRGYDVPKNVRKYLEEAERQLLDAHDEIDRCTRTAESYSDGNG